MSKSIEALQNALPSSSVTVTVLEALDFVVPGEWNNVTSFEEMIRVTTSESNPQIIEQIRRRAQELNAQDQRYERALLVLTAVDTIDQIAAGATAVSKVTDLFGGLDFLKQFTPKPETTQSIDAGLKLVAELLAYSILNGMPEASFDGIARFAIGLQDYGREELMRIATWVVIDGLLPLGPNFMQTIVGTISSLTTDNLAGNGIFKQIAGGLPGNSIDEKRSFILKALEAVAEWVGKFVGEKGLSKELIEGKLSGAVSLASGGGDYLAAALDASTSYFAHTGTQTVSRVLIQKAYASVKDEVWAAHVSSLAV